MTHVDLTELDCIYLSYDEPNKEENWAHIKNMVPWARRVDGVKGSDSAHKAAAEASTTERFLLIDGDNIPDAKFFNLDLALGSKDENCVFRWRSRNYINGLMYGNGGLSCWTKRFVMDMQTHENSNGEIENDVEFCFHPDYVAMHDCYSTTYPNGSDKQAWRAGFREGVKMCLNKGARPTLAEFQQRVHHRNLDHLTIWHNVGRDVENGAWAIAGSRMGTYMTMLTEWNYRQVQDFDALEEIWQTVKDHDPETVAGRVSEALQTQLDLPMIMLDAAASRFFKHHYRSNWHNQGIMVREIDVIRRIEKW